jgi:hypothetical protein
LGNCAYGGNIEVMEWVLSQGESTVPSATQHYIIDKAAQGGHLEFFTWALEKFGKDNDMSTVSKIAAQNGHLKLLQWLLENKLFFSGPEICKAAVNHYDVLLWLRDNECPWDEKTFRSAIIFEDL